jgi:hypothetical protein
MSKLKIASLYRWRIFNTIVQVLSLYLNHRYLADEIKGVKTFIFTILLALKGTLTVLRAQPVAFLEQLRTSFTFCSIIISLYIFIYAIGP